MELLLRQTSLVRFMVLCCLLPMSLYARVVSAEITVFVSIPPQKYLMERIGGDQVKVYSMVGAGDNAESYEPTPRQMAALANARFYFPISLPFERLWMDVIRENHKQLVIVDCCLQLMEATASHGHSEDDPHIWTDPDKARQMSAMMLDTLVMTDPVNQVYYMDNFRKLEYELISLDQELQRLFAGVKRRSFIVSHPAWSYFARRYGLKQIPLEYEGKEIGPRTLKKMIDFARAENITTIFVQRGVNSVVAEYLAREISVSMVELDPLAEDYPENINQVAQLIAQSLE